jgi:pheromone shutdown protein TraB
MVEELCEKFPTLQRTLIDEGNDRIAEMIRRTAAEHGDVAAVVGDGHVVGVVERLKDIAPEVHRLREIRKRAAAFTADAEVAPGGAAVRFGYTVKLPRGEGPDYTRRHTILCTLASVLLLKPPNTRENL